MSTVAANALLFCNTNSAPCKWYEIPWTSLKDSSLKTEQNIGLFMFCIAAGKNKNIELQRGYGYIVKSVTGGFLSKRCALVLKNQDTQGKAQQVVSFSHTKDGSQYFTHIRLMFAVLGNNLIEDKQNSCNDFQ